MNRKTLLSFTLTALLGWVLAAPAAASENPMGFTNLDNHQSSGQIQGKVVSCSPQFNPQGTMVHIPGKSVSTKLPADGAFTLWFVPEGKHTLVFEQNGREFKSLRDVEVQASRRTSLGSITLCPDQDGDGYNVTADANDTNPAVHPGAKELCDKIDNDGDGEIDEGCSYRKCPKGGKFCMSNFNSRNPWLRGDVENQNYRSDTAEVPEPAVFHTGRVKPHQAR